MKHYVVDLSAVTSWTDFIAAFNEGFVEQVGGSGWNGNLDAFDDYLWWPDEHPYNLVIRGWTACANAVNQHKAPDGQPVLDVVAEIFRTQSADSTGPGRANRCTRRWPRLTVWGEKGHVLEHSTYLSAKVECPTDPFDSKLISRVSRLR